MKKVCTLFCLVMVILCITNTTALAAEPEGKVIDLGDGFYAVETITCSPMTRSRDTTGGSVSNNVYYGSTLLPRLRKPTFQEPAKTAGRIPMEANIRLFSMMMLLI